MEHSKVVVITGASSGIGEATAKLLGERGDKIVLAARREDRLVSLVNEIKEKGGQAVYKLTDVTKVEEVEDLAKFAIEQFGRIDVWVNNAGIMALSTLDKKRIAEWDQMIDINLKGVLYGTGAALPYMREQKSGQFINISSVSGHKTGSGTAIYAATKFGVRVISETLREEEALAQSGIRVTVISPGAIATELPTSVKDPSLQSGIDQFYEALAVSADRIAESIAFAMDIDPDTGINEILVRPTAQSL
ncbi:SDR family oxidoreductase [Ectobacillus funiculus]|uniref:SDR family oxidoreductase n=1 Tax=Ectobacillus funiculus TaxID=137993 RepID=UPI00397D24D2